MKTYTMSREEARLWGEMCLQSGNLLHSQTAGALCVEVDVLCLTPETLFCKTSYGIGFKIIAVVDYKLNTN